MTDNSMDGMFAAMAEMEDAANLRLTPGQIALRDDVENTRYWARPMVDEDVVIFGVAQPVFIVERSAGFDATENRKRGYLTGTAYSAWLERGEYGDTHVSQVVPIPEDVFRAAQALNWPTFSMLREVEQRDLALSLARAERAMNEEAGA